MTLPEHTRDILNIARASDVSKSETISERQIAKWISEYRARIIAQKINKGIRMDAWMQYLNCIELTAVDRAECPSSLIESGCAILKTVDEIPMPIELTFVGSIDGKGYQVISQTRYYYITCKPYSGKDTFAYYKDGHVYIMNNLPLKYISIRGIFEQPEKVSELQNSCINNTCYNIDTEPYPIDADSMTMIRKLILENELKIITISMSDKDNDNQNIVTPNHPITSDRL